MREAFRDRLEGGQTLATLLAAYRGQPDALVLALPRGGVPVGHAVARALGLPLDVFLVRCYMRSGCGTRTSHVRLTTKSATCLRPLSMLRRIDRVPPAADARPAGSLNPAGTT